MLWSLLQSLSLSFSLSPIPFFFSNCFLLLSLLPPPPFLLSYFGISCHQHLLRLKAKTFRALRRLASPYFLSISLSLPSYIPLLSLLYRNASLVLFHFIQNIRQGIFTRGRGYYQTGYIYMRVRMYYLYKTGTLEKSLLASSIVTQNLQKVMFMCRIYVLYFFPLIVKKDGAFITKSGSMSFLISDLEDKVYVLENFHFDRYWKQNVAQKLFPIIFRYPTIVWEEIDDMCNKLNRYIMYACTLYIPICRYCF